MAQRYARALFALGGEKGNKQRARYGQTLQELAAILRQSPELARVLKAPVINIAEKRGVLDTILGQLKADKPVRDFCHLLAEKDRLSFLCPIATAYATLSDQAEGLVRGQLTTAVTLEPDRQKALCETLQRQTGSRLALSFEVDPGLLGGVVLKVGDKVLDASLRSQLNILKDTIKRGE